MISIPSDSRLDGLPYLFDIDAVSEHLHLSGIEVNNGRAVYVRYKPGTSCIVAYQFDGKDALSHKHGPVRFYAKCVTADAFSAAWQKSQNHRWLESSCSPSVIPFNRGHSLFYTFPNDTQLDGLRLLKTPKKLTRFIQEGLTQYSFAEWRLSESGLVTKVKRYKPERRAVVFSKTKAINRTTDERLKLRLYWRAYCEGQTREIFRRMEFLKKNLPESSALTTPAPLTFDPTSQVLLMEAIRGKSLEEVFSTGDPSSAMEQTGEALAELHRLVDDNLLSSGTDSYLGQAHDTQRMLTALSPEFEGQATEIFNRLLRTSPGNTDRTCLVHGDFHCGQVLIKKQRIGFVDFDRSHNGDGLTDLGNFLAHLRLLELEDESRNSNELADKFVESYFRASNAEADLTALRWWTGLSLFLLSVEPFRRLEHDWPVRVRAILDMAGDELC